MTLALAQGLQLRGRRPAILAYRIGPGDGSSADPIEVFPDSDWRATSEEAVLLRRESGIRVFVTRNRARAWERLAGGAVGGEPFDTLVSDDGYQDPRLPGAVHIALMAPGERPGLFDLLPGGPFRETVSAAARADLILTGPASVTDTLPGPGFTRPMMLPDGWDAPCIVHCALGNNQPFLEELRRAGVRILETVPGRNHGPAPLGRLKAAAARHPGAAILCTRKEGLKLAGVAGLPPVLVIDRETRLDAAAWQALEARLQLLPRNRYLVHYPRC